MDENLTATDALIGFGAYMGPDILDRSFMPKRFGGAKVLPKDLMRAFGPQPQAPLRRPNLYYRENFVDKGWLRDTHWLKNTSQKSITAARSLRAYRAFRSDAIIGAIHKAWQPGQAGFFGRFGAGLETALESQGMRSGWGGKAKLLGGVVGQAASTFLWSRMLADVVVGTAEFGVGTLIELGKPKDIQPRYFDAPFNSTMRQAGLMAISQANMRTNSAFGREASFLHGS